jgi:hypothetical protein
MTWLRLDDGFPDHPKVLELSDGAFVLFIEALCYASRHMTDGHILPGAVRRFRGSAHAGELVDAGMWEATDRGWLIHDYLDYQTPREQVDRAREANRERQKRWRERNASRNETVTHPPTPTPTPTETTPPTPPDGGDWIASLAQRHGWTVEHAQRVAEQVLSGASRRPRNAARYVLQAVARDPARYRLTPVPPSEGDECPVHMGPVGNCPGCRADTLAADA